MYAHNAASVLSTEEFEKIAKQMISHCNSAAYVFINQPGLTPNDFGLYKDEMKSLHNYVFSSSTAVAFEKVSLPNYDIFESLMSYAMKTCRLDERIHVIGNDTDSFEPYIDISSRAIRLDFPPLKPENELGPDDKSRAETLKDYDIFIRYVLGHIPTPMQTVFYMSLETDTSDVTSDDDLPRIWPEIFQDDARRIDIEKNNRINDEEPYYASYRPKFDTPKYNYISALDPSFIEGNIEILRMIVASVVLYFGFQIAGVLYRKMSPRVDKTLVKKKSE